MSTCFVGTSAPIRIDALPLTAHSVSLVCSTLMAALPDTPPGGEQESVGRATSALFFTEDSATPRPWVSAVVAEVSAASLPEAARGPSPLDIVCLAGVWAVVKVICSCSNVSLGDIVRKLLFRNNRPSDDDEAAEGDEDEDEDEEGDDSEDRPSLFERHEHVDVVTRLVVRAERSILMQHGFVLPHFVALTESARNTPS
jgi:hypothetical protein